MTSKYTLDDITEGGLFCDGDWIEKKDQDINGKIRLIQLADIGDGYFIDKSQKYINDETAERLNCTLLKKGDILVSRLGSPLGKACIFPFEGKYITAVDIAIIRIVNPNINRKYVMHLINSFEFRTKIASYQTGTTRKRISRKNLAKITFTLPSLSEQERIVEKIEELFSDLDNAVETLNATKAQLEVYRQAVYSSVYNDNNVRPITDFFEVTGGLTKNSKRNSLPQKMPYLRVANVYFNRLDLSEIKEIGVNEAEIEKCLLKKNDLLFVEGNGSKSQIGRVAIWDGSIENCLHQNHLIKARPLGNMIPSYALFYLISGGGRRQINEVSKSTSGLYTLSTNKVRELMIPYCDYEKQQQSVGEIESRLSVCKSIEETVNTALQQASAMHQSILKQAFEGRLF